MKKQDSTRLEKSSDGPISLIFNRPISKRISGFLAKRQCSPNLVTGFSFVLGVIGAVWIAFQIWWLGALFLQLSSIFAGVDGEVARRLNLQTPWGDFWDTFSDRFVEYVAFIGIAIGFARLENFDSWAWPIVGLLLGGSLLLTTLSEKYRSSTQINYPKKKFEGLFAYFTSGRDARIFWIAVALIIGHFSIDILVWTMLVVGILMHANVILRFLQIRRLGFPSTRVPAIKAVFFDFGDTLWHFPDATYPTEERIHQEITLRYKKFLSEQEILVPDSIDRLSQEIHSQWRASEVRADAGEFQSPDYLAIVHSVFEVEGIELSDSQVATLWELSNAGTSFLGCRLFEDVFDTLNWLREGGIQIGAITNRAHGGSSFLEELRDKGILQYFDVVVSSDQVGVRKPHSVIFQQALTELGVKPENAMHVGDRLQADIEGARHAGLTAVWMRRARPTEEEAPIGVNAPHYTISGLSQLRYLPPLVEARGANNIQ